jgi:DNA invertase Pin-like site-specific DNA recombinase
MSDAIEAIRRNASERAEADAMKRRATAELREHAREAHDAGESISRIAREANLTRQAVYDLLAVPQPS